MIEQAVNLRHYRPSTNLSGILEDIPEAWEQFDCECAITKLAMVAICAEEDTPPTDYETQQLIDDINDHVRLEEPCGAQLVRSDEGELVVYCTKQQIADCPAWVDLASRS